MSFDTEACGARIRELRKENKLTQEKLAEELIITDSHPRRIENGTRTGSIDLLIDITKKWTGKTWDLGKTLDQLCIYFGDRIEPEDLY